MSLFQDYTRNINSYTHVKTITNILLIHIYNYRYYLIVLLASGVRIATGNIEILVYRIYVG